MSRNKINFKLANLAILVFIIYLLYQMGYLWMGVTDKIISVISPFVIAFAVAYALYPAVDYLQKKKIPKAVAITMIIGLVIGVMALLVILIAPMMVTQTTSLITGVIKFLKDLSIEYNINFDAVMTSLNSSINRIGEMTANGILSVIGTSLGVLSTFCIILSAAIYFLIDFDLIRDAVKRFLLAKNIKAYNYVKELDLEMRKYLVGFMKVAVINFFEYTLAFMVIGHPNALLLGILAAVSGVIPYFGGIITNIIACITGFVVSPALFIRTVIVFIGLSQVDGYIISPLVYGKTNELHPLVVIFAVFACGVLMGVPGIVMSLPLAIIIFTTYDFFKGEIASKITDMKNDMRDNNGTN